MMQGTNRGYKDQFMGTPRLPNLHAHWIIYENLPTWLALFIEDDLK